jgi:tRNA dimethylallyltransferase
MADCLVITGATATGKTAVAIEVARRIDGEIISLDSRQVYRELDVGTAKATAQQRAAVPHFGLDVLSPTQRYNAGRFAQDARTWIDEIRKRGHVPLLVGGTGFFLRALTHPMFEEPELDAGRKEALKKFLNRMDREELLRWLNALDSQVTRRLSPEAGRQRLARIIEVVLLTGHTLRWWQQHSVTNRPPIETVTFVLELPRDVLYQRINTRVQEMVKNGLLEEVKGLLAKGYDENTPGMYTTGYVELIPYFKGATSLSEAIDAIQRATRRYARRQETWFRHQLPGPVMRIDATLPLEEIVQTIVNEWRERDAHRN